MKPKLTEKQQNLVIYIVSGLLAAFLLFALVINFTGPVAKPPTGPSLANVTKSTHERDRLAEDKCELTDKWYEDNTSSGWLKDDAALIEGMRYFYEKTGVQPYVAIYADSKGFDLVKTMSSTYSEKMPDDGHLVVGFLDSGEGDCTVACYAGKDASAVMDNEAKAILIDYLQYYYYSTLNNEDYFVTAFKRTADDIMARDSIAVPIVLTVFVIAAVAGGILTFIRMKKKGVTVTR